MDSFIVNFLHEMFSTFFCNEYHIFFGGRLEDHIFFVETIKFYELFFNGITNVLIRGWQIANFFLERNKRNSMTFFA